MINKLSKFQKGLYLVYLRSLRLKRSKAQCVICIFLNFRYNNYSLNYCGKNTNCTNRLYSHTLLSESLTNNMQISRCKQKCFILTLQNFIAFYNQQRDDMQILVIYALHSAPYYFCRSHNRVMRNSHCRVQIYH